MLAVVVLLCSSTLWGLTWLALKHFGSYGLHGVIVTLGAHGSVGLCALPWLWRRREVWRAHWRALLGLVFFGGLANLAFASAIVLGDVLRVMVLFYLLPAWGVLGGRWILGERIDAQRWASLVLALTGAVLVLGGLSVLYAIPSWVDWVAIGSGMTLAANNIIFRRTQGVPVPIKVGANFVGCLLWAGVLTALGFADVPHDVPGVIWVQLVMFGVVWILVATLGTLWGVHHMEAGRSSVLIIMELVTAVGSSCLLTGRKPSAVEWLGGGCILLSAVLEAWRTPNALRAPVG